MIWFDKRFNPRLRTGGDFSIVLSIRAIPHVSIHASAREATDGNSDNRRFAEVSIHASAREATC